MGRKTGFALLPADKRQEMAALGGRTAHQRGTAPKFAKGSDAARLAGRKGGEAAARRRTLGKVESVGQFAAKAASIFRNAADDIKEST